MKTMFLILFLIVVVNAEEFWIDVRSFSEYQRMNIPGHLHIPHDMILERIGEITQDTSAVIHLYCAVGGRASVAKKALESIGFHRVLNEGGIDNIKQKLAK